MFTTNILKLVDKIHGGWVEQHYRSWIQRNLRKCGLSVLTSEGVMYRFQWSLDLKMCPY